MTAPDRPCLCSRCGRPRDVPGQRYCRACRREYGRAWKAKRNRDARRYREMKLAADEPVKIVSPQTIDGEG